MIIVSECLAGVPCRMNGKDKLVPEIKRLVDEGKAVAVCPEVLGGLPTPRDPSEIWEGRVYSCNGRDVTEEFVTGAKKAMEICRVHGCTQAIMKAKSPSCGCGLIHNGTFDGGLVSGNGIFAQMLIDEGVKVMTEENFMNDVYFKRDQKLGERFEFRNIRWDEVEQAAEIEQICFPPNEACQREMMLRRVAKAPELFLVAADRQTGKIAGFLNGLSTNENFFRDEFFTNEDLQDPSGRNIMLLGLDVLPEYRGQGLARELMRQYICRERENGRRMLLLTCLDSKVQMYRKMGFWDEGIADSSWGGEQWHEMSCVINI